MYNSDIFERFTAADHGVPVASVPVKILRRHHSNSSPVKLHSHNFWEMIIILSGSCKHIVLLPDQQEIDCPLVSGNICIIAPGEKHTFFFEPGEEIQIANILFNPLVIQREDRYNLDDLSASSFINLYAYIPASRKLQDQIRLDDVTLHYVDGIISTMEQEAKSKEMGYNTIMQANFSILLNLMMREYNRTMDSNMISSAAHNGLQSALDYINQNFCSAIRLEDLAKHSNFSVRQLTRKFKEVIGLSVTQYLLQLRLLNAKALLHSTKKTTEEIAMETGFGNVSYFCSQFKKKTGMTPVQYRRLSME